MKKLSVTICILVFFVLVCPSGLFAVGTGDRIISFTSKTMNGETISIDSVIKQKPVMLFFWASW